MAARAGRKTGARFPEGYRIGMTRKGMKTGVKLPSSYEVGDGAVNLCLALLRQAKFSDAQIWQDFKETELYKDGVKGIPDSMEVACWVSRYIGD